MARLYVSESLIQLIASDPSDPRCILEEVRRKIDHPLHVDLLQTLAAIPSETIEEALTNPGVRGWLEIYEAADDSEQARFETLVKTIDDEIYERRRSILLEGGARSLPYDHPALSGVEPDDESLVSLSSFDVHQDFMQRGGFVFSPTPPLRAVNSQYWSSMVLFRLSAEISVRVRLDPFLITPVDSYSPPFYRMWVFGRDLDWQRIGQLKGEEMARWMPDNLSLRYCEFTDVIWRRRSDGVHFECEEIPKNAEERPSRYFHAIYAPTEEVFVHSDAAVRYYTETELDLRKQAHLHSLGKVGVRVKLFRVDGPLDVVTWSTLIAGSFVWNNDIQRYFRGERPFAVERASLSSNAGQQLPNGGVRAAGDKIEERSLSAKKPKRKKEKKAKGAKG